MNSKRRTDRSWIAYGDKSHEDFNRRLAERGKGGDAPWIERPWAPPGLGHRPKPDFRANGDPFVIQENAGAAREAEGDGQSKTAPPLDIPKPVLRPKGPMRSAAERAVMSERWLAAQREVALSKAPAPQKQQGPSQEPKKRERER
ncbi:MAG: hypothetical protein MRY74_00355 [Neomegalonema sp.]|nr:hypothetical protein [Neomegalonema sp.]